MAVTRLIFIYFSFTEKFSQVPFVHIEIKKNKNENSITTLHNQRQIMWKNTRYTPSFRVTLEGCEPHCFHDVCTFWVQRV